MTITWTAEELKAITAYLDEALTHVQALNVLSSNQLWNHQKRALECLQQAQTLLPGRGPK